MQFTLSSLEAAIVVLGLGQLTSTAVDVPAASSAELSLPTPKGNKVGFVLGLALHNNVLGGNKVVVESGAQLDFEVPLYGDEHLLMVYIDRERANTMTITNSVNPGDLNCIVHFLDCTPEQYARLQRLLGGNVCA